MSGPSNSYQPASGGDVARSSRSDRKRSSSSSGLTPGSSAPEHLQDQRLAEHDRRVGLLDADRPHRRPCRRARRRPLGPAEAQRALARPSTSAEPRACGAAARARPRDRRARRRRSSRRRRRSRARPSPPPRAAGRAAPGRARASRRGSAPRRARARAAALVAQRDALEHVDVRRPRAPWTPNQRCCDDPLVRARSSSSAATTAAISHPRSSSGELEPVEAARRQRQQVRQLADRAGSASGRTSPPGGGPCTRDRSSSTAWAERARLCTHSITSSS